MNEHEAKFAITLVMLGLMAAHALPAMNKAKKDHDKVGQMVSLVYVAPNPNDPQAPSGNVSVDDLQKYADQKAAERNARGF